MKKCDKNNGITLIALVVTIIVLLILAGISINMLTGQNGILNRAQEAKEKTEEAQKDEANKIATMELMVQSAGIKVTNPSIYGENPNAQATADGAGKYFALPTGAKYIEGTVDTGVVIEINENEFVWVPVDDVVLDESKVENLPTNSLNGTSSGKTYTPMAVKVGNDYKGLLYDYSENNAYLMYNDNTNNYLGSSLEHIEPEIVSDDGGENDMVEEKITSTKLKNEYNEMISSILRYKGFYVARYELGLDKTSKNIVCKNASIEKNNTITADSSNDDSRSWYGLYNKAKEFAKESDKIESSIIWGSQYDAMLNWMIKTGNKVGSPNKLKTNTEAKRVTGIDKNDVINNIYDLYGCHYEWTLEAVNGNARVIRGGSNGDYCSPASYGYSAPKNESTSMSSRVAIYIK